MEAAVLLNIKSSLRHCGKNPRCLFCSEHDTFVSYSIIDIYIKNKALITKIYDDSNLLKSLLLKNDFSIYAFFITLLFGG